MFRFAVAFLRCGGPLRHGLALFAFVLVGLLPAGAAAQAREWRIADFNSSLAVGPDASVVVRERIAFAFTGAWNGVSRTIPIQYQSRDGASCALILDVRSVTDGSGSSLHFESSVSNGSQVLKIYVPGARDATREVDITYVVRNAIRSFAGHDELYWNVTGNDWPVPIAHAGALVTLPESASGAVQAQAFTGPFGATERFATTDVHDASVTIETTRDLPVHAGLTIDVSFPRGVVAEPGLLLRMGRFLTGHAFLLLPLLTAAVMFGLWLCVGREPDPGVSVAPTYAPPPGVSPAEVGALIDDSVDSCDLASTIVDLAVRRYLRICRINGASPRREYRLELLKKRENWGGDLLAHERLTLEGLFSGGEQVELATLRDRFSTSLSAIKGAIRSSLKRMYTTGPRAALAYSIAGALFIWFVLYVSERFIPPDVRRGVSSEPFELGCIAATVFIWMLFRAKMTAKSMLGAKTVVAIRGFQEFVRRVDADRLKRAPPDTFEKYLPYAMALGLERRWAGAFEGITQEPPAWYEGDGISIDVPFDTSVFAVSVHDMANDMRAIFFGSSSGSGSSSDSGSDGSSGGGSGGGGGDAF